MARPLFIVFLAAALALVAPAWAQDSVKVTASVDAEVIGIEDQIQLTVSVAGSASRVSPPDVERAIEDFLLLGQSQMSRTSIVNFRMSQSRDFIYTLLPKKEGALRIPTLDVVVDGKNHRTTPIVVTVRPGSAKPPRQHQHQQQPWDPWGGSPPFGTTPRDQQRIRASEHNMREGVRVHAVLSNDSPYVGEAVALRYRILSRYPLLNINVVELPKYESFMVEPIDGERRLEPKPVQHEGEAFYEVYVFERILIPAREGEFTLDPMTLAIEVQAQGGRGFVFGAVPERVVRRSTEASLRVRPLPKPVPAHFSGAVGEFTLRESLSADRLDVSDALTLSLTLDGRGNVRSLRPPKFPPQTSFTAHDPEARYTVSPDSRGLRGRAEISYMLLPRAPGRHRVPALPVIVFNPKTGKYENLTTLGGEVTVEGTPSVSVAVRPAEAAPLPGAAPRRVDIHPITLQTSRLTNAPPLYRRTGALAFWFAAPLLGNAAALAALALRRRLREDTPARRARSAARDARARLGEAESLLKEGKRGEAARAVEEALLGYAAAKAMRPAAGLSPSDAGELFRANGVDDSASRGFLNALARAQKARYAATSDATLGPSDAGAARAALDAVERQWGRKRILRAVVKPWMRRSAVLAVAMIPLLWIADFGLRVESEPSENPQSAIANPQLPEERFAQANALYEAGDHAEAAAAYRSLLADGFSAPEIHYNLGCAEYKAARLGHAAWAFEQTLLLRPGDRRARENLAFVEREAFPGGARGSESGAEAFLGYLYRMLPFRASLVLLLAALWAACPLWLFYGLTRREGFLHGAAAATCALLLLAGLAGAQAAYGTGLLGRGVALDSPTALRAGPGGAHAPLAEIPPASRVHILDRRGEWVLVAAGGAEGWARAEQVEEIVLP